MSASPTIFLSYARQDQHCAERLAAMLSARGLSVWWDRNIRAGRSYERVIEEALSEAQIVVVLWSRSSVESDWVRAEASYALEANKLLPLNIDGTRLPLRFRPVQTLGLTSWNEAEDHPEWALLFGEIDERLTLLDEAARREQEARTAEEARLQAEKERAELEARKAEEARREAERQRQAEEAARREQEARAAEEARLQAEKERAELEARKAEEARRAAERQRQAEEAARYEQEARAAEEARLQAEKERAELEARKAEEARRDVPQIREPAKQPHSDQLRSQERRYATAAVPPTFGKLVETDNRVSRRKVANSNLLRISIALCATAILIFPVLLKTDYPSRWVAALEGAAAPQTPPTAGSAPEAVTSTSPRPESDKPLPVAPPSAPAAPNPVSPPATSPPDAAAEPGMASEPTASAPAAPTAPAETAPNSVSEPATLPPTVPPSETAADTSPQKPVVPSPVPPPEKLAIAIPSPAPAVAPKPEPTPPPAEIPPEGTRFQTIVPTVLRQEPAISASKLADLNRGIEVMVVGKETDGWYKVKVPSARLEGFVAAKTLRAATPVSTAAPPRLPVRPSESIRVRQIPLENLSSGRCASIIERSQLGEPVSDADRQILRNNCR